MCSCGCNNCGDKPAAPRMNGTEVTVLSGTRAGHVVARKNDGETLSKGNYIVLGSAAAVALIAFFVSRR
jgi:hypothetical protein